MCKWLKSAPGRWVALLALGLFVGGTVVAAEDGKKAEPGKEPARKDKKAPAKARAFPLPDIEDLLDKVGPGLDQKQMEMLKKQLEEARKQMEEAMRRFPRQPMLPNLPAFPGGAWGRFGGLDRATAGRQEPRLGVQLRKPGATLVDQLDLPRDQGMVVEEVGPNSPAGKAGLKAHDILLELDGKAVSSKPADFGKMLGGIQSDKAINAVVMRKGKKETIKGLKLARASAAGPANLGGFPNLPRFGNGLVLPNLAGKSITLSRSNDQFTARQRDGNVTITVKGKIDQGKAEASEITIQDGGQSKTYDSLTKVPAAHQEAVKNLIQMSQRGRVRIDQ